MVKSSVWIQGVYFYVSLYFLGNEMGYASVDAAIAENLKSKGNIFSANINLSMNEHYVDNCESTKSSNFPKANI